MSNDHRLLRKYIKESLSLHEVGLSDLKGMARGALGFGDSKSGPQKWFASFMGRQLDKAEKKIDSWLGEKLDAILPDDVKAKIKDYEKESGESASTTLTKVIEEWMSDIEDMADKEFDPAQKKQIYEFASKEYAAILKKDSDVKKALLLIKRKLDMKYGSLLSKEKEKTPSKKNK